MLLIHFPECFFLFGAEFLGFFVEDPSLCALVATSTLNCEVHLSFYCVCCVFLIREISVSPSMASSCLAPLMFFCGFLFIFSRWLCVFHPRWDSHFWVFCVLNCVGFWETSTFFLWSLLSKQGRAFSFCMAAAGFLETDRKDEGFRGILSSEKQPFPHNFQ